MGCDIHMRVQRRDETGTWRFVETRAFGRRNYNLFAALAGVRNGTGFAGAKTAEPIQPIAEPRGVPPQAEQAHVAGDLGDHSFSHVTLAELRSYAWDQPLRLHGIVDAENFARFKEHGEPDEWCGGISGPNIKHVSNAKMEREIAEGRPTNSLYTRVSWVVPLRRAIGEDWFAFMDTLAALGAPDCVRIVFGFDS